MNAMVQVTQRMTADEYLAMPFDERRTELVEGEVIMHLPLSLHQFVLTDLVLSLTRWAAANPGLGRVTLPIDVKLDEYNVVGPDVMWYAEGRVPGRHDPRPYAVPDLAIEVRSPSTWRYDIGAKKAAYERAGLRELWLVDTAASEVLIFRRSTPRATSFDVSLELAVGDELTSPQLPGFTLALASLFGD